MSIIHPSKRAEALASAIRSDSVAAGQIKEFIPKEELASLFGLPSEEDVEDLRDKLADAEVRACELEEALKEFKD